MDALSQAGIQKIVEKELKGLTHFVYLMGSAGTDRFNHESDIDLAVYWKKVPDFSEQVALSSSLQSQFNREIDLVSLNGSDLIFSRQVLEKGRLILCHSNGKRVQWIAEQLSRYPDFKRSRAIIEKNILIRKKNV